VLRVDGIATKRMKLKGREVAIHPAPNLARGIYRVEVAGSVGQLRSHIEGLSTAETLVWGLPAHTAGDFVTKSELANLNGSAPATTITRTRDHFEYAPAPGWMMLDLDYVPAGATLDSLRDLLVSVAPGLGSIPMLAMSSASANIYLRGSREPLRGLTGARFYVAVADARRIPELGQRLFDRLILAGHGRADISKTGQILFRTPLDGAVWQPERGDFAAGAQVDHPLEQRRDVKTWSADASTQLDDAALPPLTGDEQTRLGEVKAELRAVVKDEATKVRAAYKAERAAAGREVAWAEDGERIVLEGSHEIMLTGGAVVTVDEILLDPALHHGAECADPLEPDYNNDDRIAVIRADDSPNVFSHAHGGQLFVLRPSREVAQRAAQDAFEADPSAMPPAQQPGLEPLPTEGERLAALTGDADAVFLSEVPSLQGDPWARWEQLDAAARTRDPLTDLYRPVRDAARAARGERPAIIRGDVRTAMAGHAGWAALPAADQALLLKAAMLSLREQSVERRTPRLITTIEPQDFMIDHLLPRRGLVGMVGAPGEGKSWLGLEMAALIGGAPGRFDALAVQAQGPVWYFLSEDSHGFAARARAREHAHGAAPHLHLFEEVPLLTAPISDLLAFLKAAREQQPDSPALVVLDIFADATPGEDENAAAVMVPVMRRGRLIGRLLNCAVLLIHHTPKANPKDARGSSAFKGALDVMVSVTQDAKGTITLSPVKFKSSPLRRDLKFHVRDTCSTPAPTPPLSGTTPTPSAARPS
jgi:hypothetical protein